MPSYCLKWKKYTENIDPVDSKASNGRAMSLSKCALCGSKNSRFDKKQEAKRLFNNIGLKNDMVKHELRVTS